MKQAAITPLDAARMLHAAGGALLTQAGLHAELAGIEWEEEKNRLLRMLAAGMLGFAALLCTLIFGGALVLVAAWESPYRIPALAAVVILSGSGTFAAWRRVRAEAALGRQSFAASREELAVDAALLKASA